jgi:hypothetical protein
MSSGFHGDQQLTWATEPLQHLLITRGVLIGIVGTEPRPQPSAINVPATTPPELLRPLHEYEAITGGAW